MKAIFDWCIANYGTLAAICTSLFTVFLIGRKWIKNAIRSILLSNQLHTIYGDDPAQTIKEIHDTIQRSHDTLEIRQCISEKHMQIGVYMREPKTGRTLWSNQFLNNLFGLDSSDMMGFGWINAIADFDKERVHKAWMYAVNNNTPYECTYTIINQINNTVYKVNSHALSVVNDKNEILCYVGYLTIIAEGNTE